MTEHFEWLEPRLALLHRPDALLGSNDPVETFARVLSEDMAFRNVTYTMSGIPMKIFDEVLTNSFDASSRDSSVRNINVRFDRVTGEIAVFNDGNGIPVELFKDSGRYIPSVIFSELNAGSNFDDSQQRTTAGRNGVGSSCANVWSTRFNVSVCDRKRVFEQTFENNMAVASEPAVKARKGKGFVCVTFTPDYDRTQTSLEKDAGLLEDLMRTKTNEASLCQAQKNKKLSVTFNDKAMMRDPKLYMTQAMELDSPDVFAHVSGDLNEPNCVLLVAKGAGSVAGFVNNIYCPAGAHVTLVQDRIIKSMQDAAEKTHKTKLSPKTVKDHLAVLVIATVYNPRFTSQLKDRLSTTSKDLGFDVDVAKKLATWAKGSGVLEEMAAAEQAKSMKTTLKKNNVGSSKKCHIEKYDPAHDLATDGPNCHLLILEGDSAKSLAVSGLSVVGREKFGIFPLRGVPLNVRTAKDAMSNKEVSNLVKICGVYPGCSWRDLKYGKIVILSDQDYDGSHIGGLIMNMFAFMVKDIKENPDVLKRFVTPIIKATHKHDASVVKVFHSMQRFREFEAAENPDEYTFRYLKGLGTNTASEARDLFRRLDENMINITIGEACERELAHFFDDRFSDVRKEKIQNADPASCIDYENQKTITGDDFLNKEMIQWACYANKRGIAHGVDGLTPARRKCLYYFLTCGNKGGQKISQVAAAIAAKTMYLHGEASLIECLVGTCQDYVGTNNVAFLQPIGQFGSRLDTPRTHAAPRYIFTKLDPVAKYVFRNEDLDLLQYESEENVKIEPTHLVPVIPTVLVNGAQGLTCGFNTYVPTFNACELCDYLVDRLAGSTQPFDLQPYFEGFKGATEASSERVVTRGKFERIDDRSVIVTELPVCKWTEVFLTELKKDINAAVARKGGLKVVDVINDSTDVLVSIRVKFENDISGLSDEAIESSLKLTSTFSVRNMNLFASDGKLVKYDSYQGIADDHYTTRLALYGLRRKHQLDSRAADLVLKSEKLRFVEDVLEKRIALEPGRSAEEFGSLLETTGYLKINGDYEHLLKISIRSFTAENVSSLRDEIDALNRAIEALAAKTPESIWTDELCELKAALEDYRTRLAARYSIEASPAPSSSKLKKRGAAAFSKATAKRTRK